MGEVMTSVSANVNHGVLVTFFRHLNDRLVAGEAVSFELIDATMSFLAFVATSPSHSNMLMGAGILRLLLEMLNTAGDRRENVSRVITKTSSALIIRFAVHSAGGRTDRPYRVFKPSGFI